MELTWHNQASERAEQENWRRSWTRNRESAANSQLPRKSDIEWPPNPARGRVSDGEGKGRGWGRRRRRRLPRQLHQILHWATGNGLWSMCDVVSDDDDDNFYNGSRLQVVRQRRDNNYSSGHWNRSTLCLRLVLCLVEANRPWLQAATVTATGVAATTATATTATATRSTTTRISHCQLLQLLPLMPRHICSALWRDLPQLAVIGKSQDPARSCVLRGGNLVWGGGGLTESNSRHIL